VDEAGMVSGRQMEGLLKLADREGARILFSGDTRQIQSVEASDALRILERESQMKSVSLTRVQRQTQAEYRDAIQTLRQAPEQGFQKFEQLGAIREVPYLERPQAVASAYRELTTDPNRKVLVVAGTGAPMKVLQELMRHASIQTTMNVYGQAMSPSKREVNGKVVELVLKPVAASA
jgi:ATP-dependent exoDNAse (exonuclease V) alpha subunit